MKKLLSILIDVVIVMVILTAVVITFISFNTNEKGINNIYGYIFLNIQTESMEPTIMTGDLIVTKETAFKDLKVDDVISFLAKEQDKTIIKTHRIVKIEEVNGIVSITTKGDNNDAIDESTVEADEFVSIYDGTRIPFVGGILTFSQSQVGFFIFIILPLFVVFIYQLYKFIILIVEEKKKELVAQIRKEELNNRE